MDVYDVRRKSSDEVEQGLHEPVMLSLYPSLRTLAPCTSSVIVTFWPCPLVHRVRLSCFLTFRCFCCGHESSCSLFFSSLVVFWPDVSLYNTNSHIHLTPDKLLRFHPLLSFTQMGLPKVVCMGLLAEVARSQGLQTCSFATSPCAVRSTEDAATLAAPLQGSNGDFSVLWDREVFVSETIRVMNGTSLNITGAGPRAAANGQDTTQLFYVDGGSSLHLSELAFFNCRYSDGGAIYAEQSSVLVW